MIILCQTHLLPLPPLCLCRNTGEDLIKCGEWSCRFQAVPGLEWYHVSVVVRNQLGEEKQSYSFNITDRGEDGKY